MENHVSRVIFTSSDKAVNPTNVMGTSKLMGERLITAANSNTFGERTILASTRFGNVLGSSGSVIPIFQKQIEKGGPVTLTDDAMTRFVMNIDTAVRLVIDSALIARGGEVFITKMPVVRIRDLAQVMIHSLAPLYGRRPEEIEVVQIGVKPGEKRYEELMSLEETRRAVELSSYFCVLPAFRGLYRDISYDYPDLVSDRIDDPYVSTEDKAIDLDSLKQLLEENGLLDPGSIRKDHPDRRYWPGDGKG
jgi:FlaA1/EpsC-like NDP-sugar epimerase